MTLLSHSLFLVSSPYGESEHDTESDALAFARWETEFAGCECRVLKWDVDSWVQIASYGSSDG